MEGTPNIRRTLEISLALILLSVSFAPAQPVIKWKTYTDISGYYTLKYPEGWQVLTKGNAVVIKGPGGPDTQGAFGITPRAAGITIEESVNKEFSDPDRPKDLVKGMSRIAHIPATKVVGSKKGHPNIKLVEYYVLINSQEYYIIFQSAKSSWNKNSTYFDGMIASMKFLK